ncbi:MAG: ACP synthase, partial [Planctomycetota bacterium]
AARIARQRGVGAWLVSLSHVESMAIATVLALRDAAD